MVMRIYVSYAHYLLEIGRAAPDCRCPRGWTCSDASREADVLTLGNPHGCLGWVAPQNTVVLIDMPGAHADA